MENLNDWIRNILENFFLIHAFESSNIYAVYVYIQFEALFVDLETMILDFVISISHSHWKRNAA